MSDKSDLLLEFENGHWQIRDPEQPKIKPVFVDFLSNEFLRRFKEPKGSQLLYRAVNAPQTSIVLDATAGLGSDSVMLASWGFKVFGCEQNEKIFTLLADGVKRFSESENKELKAIAANLDVRHVNALQAMKSVKADVIYLDPMYPDLKSTALPKKEMQILRKIFTEVDASRETKELLNQALLSATKRVVLKRPPQAEQIKKPSHSLAGKAVRFDIYLI